MPPADAPHVAYRQFLQRLRALLLRIDDIEPPPGIVCLGEFVGRLGQHFRRGDAQTDRDADSAPGGADDLAPQLLEIETFHSRKVEEGFVDAVYFEVGDEGGPNAVHAVAHVAVEFVVRGERDDAVFPDGICYLEQRVAHPDISLRRPVHGYRTAVVVRGHDNGLSVQPRLHGLLAGAVK